MSLSSSTSTCHSVEFARLAHVLSAPPEIELRRAEHVTRLGKHRLAALGQPADVVGMAVGDHDHVDVLSLVAGLRQPRGQMALGHPAAQLLVLAAQGAVAGVEQHQLLAGVHKGWNERMLKAVGLDAVGTGQLLRGLRRLIAGETGIQPLADDFAVHHIGDLETAELEAIDSGLHFALH